MQSKFCYDWKDVIDMLEKGLTCDQCMVKIELWVNPELWELDDIKKEFSKHLEKIQQLKGIEIENFKDGGITLFEEGNYLEKKGLPRKVIFNKVKDGKLIEAAIVTMEDDLDIIIEGSDQDTINYIIKLVNDGIEIEGDEYCGERLLEGIIITIQKYRPSYFLVIE